MYRAGRYAPIMEDNSFRSVFDLGYRITGGEGEGHRELWLEFKNGPALVMVYFYHNSLFLYPYAIFCIVSSFLFFLSVILVYISRKLKQITAIQNGILQDVYKRQPNTLCKIPTYGRSSADTCDRSNRISKYPIPFVSTL